MKLLNWDIVGILELLIALVLGTLVLKSSINSITVICLLAYVAYLIFKRAKGSEFNANKKSLILLLLPYLFLFIISLQFEWARESEFLLRSIPLLLFPVCFYLLKGQWSPSRQRVFNILSVLVSIFNVTVLAVALFRQVQNQPDFERINWYIFSYQGLLKTFDVHATYLGMLNVLILFYLIYSWSKKKPWPNWVSITMIFLSTLLTFLSGSRIAVVTLLIVLVYLLIENFTWRRMRIITGIVIIAALILSSIPIVKERVVDTLLSPDKKFEYAKYGQDAGKAASLEKRLQINLCGLKLAKENWLFGFGRDYEKEALLLKCYEEKGLLNASQQNFNVHNQYIGWLLSGGVVLLVSFVVVFWISIQRAVMLKDPLYIGFILIVLLACLTENIFERHFGIVYFALLNSWFFYRQT